MDIEKIAKCIPKGHDNALPLKTLVTIFENHGLLDDELTEDTRLREARRMISRVGIDYVICNLQDGKGYFRPTKEDTDNFRKWISQEENRAKRIGRRLHMGKKLFEDYLKERCEEQQI